MTRQNKLLSIIYLISKRYTLLVLSLIFSILGAVIFALLPPLALEKITNTLALHQEITWTMALSYFGLLALAGLFDAFKEMNITLFGQKITHEVRHVMSEKLIHLPASYFTQCEAGVIVSHFTNDVSTIEILFKSGIIGMFADACKIIGILIIIFTKSIGLGLLLVFVTPILFFFTRAVQKNMLQAQLSNLEAIGKLNQHVPETIKNIRMIHVLQKERYMEEKYDEKIGESYNAIEKANFYDSIYSPTIIVISTILIACMMILAASGGKRQSFFGLNVGSAVAVIAYVSKVFEPLESMGMEIQNIQSAIAGVRRINLFLNEEERSIPTASLPATSNNDNIAISLSHITFGYSDDKMVLNDLSFKLKQGESVTLVGRTGAGKSTIFKLLLGSYSAQQGEILVLGRKPTDILDTEKRQIFGYVEQFFRKVPGTIYDQIAVFDSSITQEEVRKATQIVGIDERIMVLPKGYETNYDDSLFSQGQRQLLSIARAIVANPMILLLDEITANLDAETEEKVLLALKNACCQRTVISISHRLYENTGGRIIEI